MTELQEMAECWRWHWNTFPEERGWLRRIKNELDNHPRKSKKDIIIQLSENKSTGIINGTPDFMYMRPEQFSFVEHKLIGGVLSEEQKAFRKLAALCNIPVFVTYGVENFKKLIYDLRK